MAAEQLVDEVFVPDAMQVGGAPLHGGVFVEGVVLAREGPHGEHVAAHVAVAEGAVEGLVHVADEMHEEAQGVEPGFAFELAGLGQVVAPAVDLADDVFAAFGDVQREGVVVPLLDIEIDVVPAALVGIERVVGLVAAHDVGPGRDFVVADFVFVAEDALEFGLGGGGEAGGGQLGDDGMAFWAPGADGARCGEGEKEGEEEGKDGEGLHCASPWGVSGCFSERTSGGAYSGGRKGMPMASLKLAMAMVSW